MVKKRIIKVLFLIVISIFLCGFSIQSPIEDMKLFLNLKDTYANLSNNDYEKFQIIFNEKYTNSPFKRDVDNFQYYFLLRDGNDIPWGKKSPLKYKEIMSFILDHHVGLDPLLIEKQFNHLLKLVKKTHSFKGVFNKYISIMDKDYINQQLKLWMKKDKKLAFLYGWYFFHSRYYSFSNSIFKSFFNMKYEFKSSLYYLSQANHKLKNYLIAKKYMELFLKNYPRFKNKKDSYSYNLYFSYFKTLWNMGKKKMAFLKLQKFNSRRTVLSFYYQEYLFAKSLQKNVSRYEKRIIKSFPKTRTAFYIKRRKLLTSIKNNQDNQSFQELEKLLSHRKDYTSMLKASMIDQESIEKVFVNNEDLFFFHLIKESQYNPYPELKNKVNKWLSKEISEIKNQKGKKSIQIKNAISVFYLKDNNFKLDILRKNNSFFNDYYDMRKSLDPLIKIRIHAFVKNNLSDYILREIENKYKGDEVTLYDVKRYLYQYSKDHYNLMNLVKKYLNYRTEKFVPRKMLQDVYPRPYYSFVRKLSKKYKVPVNFIYSIMRAESHFKETALSHAGAQGMMQVMPFLSEKIFKKNKEIHQKYKKYDPYNPYLNIEVAIFHLSRLQNKFKNNLIQVASAYNAGGSRVVQWSKDNDNWLEYSLFIPFYETQYYIHKVFRNLEVYNSIY